MRRINPAVIPAEAGIQGPGGSACARRPLGGLQGVLAVSDGGVVLWRELLGEATERLTAAGWTPPPLRLGGSWWRPQAATTPPGTAC